MIRGIRLYALFQNAKLSGTTITVTKLDVSLTNRIESLPAASTKTGWKHIPRSALAAKTQFRVMTRDVEWYFAAIKNASSDHSVFCVSRSGRIKTHRLRAETLSVNFQRIIMSDRTVQSHLRSMIQILYNSSR
jgi:hypothetical protein